MNNNGFFCKSHVTGIDSEISRYEQSVKNFFFSKSAKIFILTVTGKKRADTAMKITTYNVISKVSALNIKLFNFKINNVRVRRIPLR